MNVSGCWEARTKDRLVCRWFVAWETPSPDLVAGAIAGFSGHGAFQVERILAVRKGKTIAHFYYDFSDAVTGEEIDFQERAQKYIAICERGLDVLWEWNDNDEWNDSDDVILRKGCEKRLERSGDLLMLRGSEEKMVRQFCDLIGLTAGPK